MAGLISTGLEYQNKALSGFVRESAQQNEIDATNRQLEDAKKAQEATQTSMLTVAGGMGGAYLGAQIGAIGGPWGMVAGAAIGFLFSKLF